MHHYCNVGTKRKTQLLNKFQRKNDNKKLTLILCAIDNEVLTISMLTFLLSFLLPNGHKYSKSTASSIGLARIFCLIFLPKALDIKI